MASNSYNTLARTHYFNALCHWKNHEEHCTSVALNAARDAALNGRHSTELTEDDIKAIMPDLTVREFFGLYGDPSLPGKKSAGPWVQQTALIEKATRHHRILERIISPEAAQKAKEATPILSVA